MSRQSPQSAVVVTSHEELFLARYQRLLAWAMRLTAGDRARAEDLVQDAFVQFTVARPDLSRVANLDGYLHAMLRNLHTSQARRAARLGERALPAFEYDSAELSLRATDPRSAQRTQDELRACCRYACARKETSKAGSVLILRFFHGYYPREIAEVLGGTRESVEERLRVARGEARQFLKDPSSLRFLRGRLHEEVRFARTGYTLDADELLADLRRAIFDSRQGDCPAAGELARLYAPGAGAVETKTLAHLVSCPRCMDEVNRLLGLAPLSERYPTDTADAEPPDRDGGDDDNAGGPPRGGATAEQARRCRRRARDVFEHQPRELSVAVNGRVLASQKTGAPRCEQRLAVTLGEEVEFVEVFSEQEVRLLMLRVDERAADGDGRPLTASVALSDERRLEATLSPGEPWPSLLVVYEDSPAALAATRSTVEAPADGARALRGVAPALPDAEAVGGSPAGREARSLGLTAAASRVSGWLGLKNFILRPAPLTAALALFVAAALLLTRVGGPAVSAAELLGRAGAAEDRLASDAGAVLHRTFLLEESVGGVRTRRRVEVWQSAARGLKARRVYDGEGRLVAGEWGAGGGAVYVRGLQARASAAGVDARSLAEAGEVWRLDLSAKTFAALVGDARGVTVEDALGAYALEYRGGREGVVSATLRLSKADLRATAQTLTLSRGEGTTEYRFFEGRVEKLRAEEVAPAVFEPDPELAGGAAAAPPGGGPGSQAAAGAASPAGPAAPAAVASPELEVEVAYLLSRVKADLGEQITLTRTTGGQLRVEALAETEARRDEILRALGPVAANPAVVLDVTTVAERARRTGAEEPAREVEVVTGAAPADADLRRYLAARGVGGERVGEEARRLAARAMSHSRQALLHASALRRLASRFSPEEARALDEAARGRWLAMVREHARAYAREVRALDGELRPVFPHAQLGTAGPNGAGPARAAARLVEISYASDAAVRSAFAASSDASGAARLRSQEFWRALGEGLALAAAVEAAYAQ